MSGQADGPSKAAWRLRLDKAFLRFIGPLEGWLLRRATYRYVLRPRPDDIYLAAWQGTGAEVLMMMLHQLKNERDLPFTHIERVVQPFEFALYLGQGRALAAQPGPRLFRTYSSPRRLPRAGRFIFLMRRPEDIVESSARQEIFVTGIEELGEKAVEQFLSARGGATSWFDYAENWWRCRHKPNVLVLRYEEILEDLADTARKVAEHCGLPCDEERIARAAARSHPDIIADHVAAFDPRIHQIDPLPDMTFIRKGKTGDGRDLFSGRREQNLQKKIRALRGCLSTIDDLRFHLLVRRPMP